MAKEESEVLTVEEAASLLRISEVSVRTLLRQKRLPGAKVGREWRIRRDDLREFLRSGQLPQDVARSRP